MSSLFDPDTEPAEIHRTACLATRWYDDDPMPHVCALKHGHVGDHATKAQAIAVGYVAAVNWHNDEEAA